MINDLEKIGEGQLFGEFSHRASEKPFEVSEPRSHRSENAVNHARRVILVEYLDNDLDNCKTNSQ